jgi:hypothetical protein
MFRAAPRRRGGLVRAAATTAVVAGTATAVSGRVAHRQDQKYAGQEQDQMAQQAALQSQQELADLEAQVSALQSQQVQQAAMMAPPAAAPAGGGSDVMDQLQQLVQMKQAGLLTDEEFQIAKTRLLAG